MNETERGWRADNNIEESCAHNITDSTAGGVGIKQNVCPRCGEPVREGGTICMVCGQSLKKHSMMPRGVIVVMILGVVAVILGYLLFPVIVGPTTVTSTGNVRFSVYLTEESMSVDYGGVLDGRDVADLQIAVLAEGGRSSPVFSFKNPQTGAVLGPVETGIDGRPVGVYYVAVFTDGTEISNTIPV